MTDNFEPHFKIEQIQTFKNWDELQQPAKEVIDTEALFRKECEQLREEARKTGFEEGLRQANEQIMQQKDALNQAISALLKPMQLLDEHLVHEILQTMLWLCKACIGVELSIHPEKLQALLERIKDILPVLKDKKVLAMHPLDLEWMRAQLSEENIPELTDALVADETLSRGDFYLRGEQKLVDGTLATRLHSVFADFLAKEDWLVPQSESLSETILPCSNPD